MTITRLASAEGNKHVARMAAAGVALAAVTALSVGALAERAAVAASFSVLGHLHWLWIPAALLLESVSMAAFAIMLRRLLAAGGARVGIRPMLATAYAANAVSVSVPLAGPALATAFTFRRFTRQGADAPLAGWSLLASGVASSAAAALIVVGGGLASGNIMVTAVTVPGGVLVLAVLVAAVAAVRRPRLRDALERPAEWMLRRGSRMLRRPAADPGRTIGAWAQRLGSLQLPPSGWIMATGLSLANWLADAAVLAVSIRATGATVPWHDLLLVYGSGIAAQSLNITPGGLGVAEGSLSLALVATGLGAGQALAAVLLYRLASFWLVALAGWLVVFWLRRPRARRGPGPSWRAPREQDAAMATDLGTTDLSITDAAAGLGAHELVLLHGQPGSPAGGAARCDQTSTSTGRSGAMRTTDTARCGAPSSPSNAPCCGNSTSWSRLSRPSGHRCSCSLTPRTPWFPSKPRACWPAPCRMFACSSSRARVITCPDEPPRWSPMRSWRSWPRPRSPTSPITRSAVT
jgi:putative heme transporter